MDRADLVGPQGDHLALWCPGCRSRHIVPIAGPQAWTWDFDLVAPTLSPSILVQAYPGHQPRCHSFVRAGQWEFCLDSEHDLAGEIVPLLPVAAWP